MFSNNHHTIFGVRMKLNRLAILPLVALMTLPLVARPKPLAIIVHGELIPTANNFGCNIRLTYRLPIGDMEDFESVTTEIRVEYRVKNGSLETQRFDESWHHLKSNGDTHEVERRILGGTECKDLTLTGRIQVLKAECR